MAINTTLVSNTIVPLYNKKLLDHAVQLTKLVDYAQQEELPAGIGANVMRFFRPPAADLTQTGAPAALTEGTPISAVRDPSWTNIDVTLAQRGQVVKITDVANNIGLIKFLDGAIGLMGEEFALDVDGLIRAQLCNATTGLTKRYAQGATTFAGLAAASAAAGCITPRDLLDSVVKLKINRAPTFGGSYVAILPPQITRDILNDSTWREIIRQNDASRAYKGEVGDFFGTRIIEATNPHQEDETEGTFASTFSTGGTNTTGLIYTGIVTGKGSYGCVNMKKMGASLNKPQIITDKPDKSDPLGQFIYAGWKAYWASTVLNPNWGIALRAKSQFV